ncbi:MAG: hypothetical protein ACYTF0_00575 [Planctomycetota bacterium]|jgi:hypothetical protein
MLRSTTALTLLCSTTLIAAEGELLTKRSSLPMSYTPPAGRSLDDVVAAKLWVTSDNGATWHLFERSDAQPPRFAFRAGADGTYGFATTGEFNDGTIETKPAVGSPPHPGYIVTIDRRAPTVEEFSVTANDDHQVTIKWLVSDDHLAHEPVQLEMAPAGSDTWLPLGSPRDASGSWLTAFPGGQCLRLIASDRAGNQAMSAVWPAIDSTVGEAIAALPTVAAADEAAAAALAPTEAAVETASITTAASDEPDEAPAPAPVVALPPLHELAPLPPAVVSNDHASIANAADAEATLTTLGSRGMIHERAANAALASARRAVLHGQRHLALRIYQRLADSPRAAEARAEEVLCLAHEQRTIEAHARIAATPPEAYSPRLSLIHATLLLHEERYQEAIDRAAAVPQGDDHERSALWLTALALGKSEHEEAALRIIGHLAHGSDVIAERARRLLSAIP